ncbi:MAG: type II toxin-antitoxin system RelE/ParE family toxin [bacterium]
MSYSIVFTASADKQLQRFATGVQKLLVKKIKNLLDVTQKNNNVKKLFGASDLYRLRMGDYRVIYQIRKQELIILVLKVGHRKDVYKKDLT